MGQRLLRSLRILATAAVVAGAGAACTVHQTEPPPLSGPSTLSRSVQMQANPDRITQDGASQSSIQVLVIGPDGRGMSGIVVRLDMEVGGQLVDFGTLSARTVVTGSDGTARATYTAPPPSPGPNTLVNTVSIRAVPVSTDAQAAIAFTVDIRLMPPGVILPIAGTPKAQFTVTPTPVNINLPANFDASASCPAIDQSGNCVPNAGTIVSYAWNFGDNTPGVTGPNAIVQHTFSNTGTFSVTLTVTNDRTVAASTTTTLSVGSSAPPSGDWVNSPTNPVIGDNVIFNADKVQPAPGRTIVQYSWNFGDGATGSGFLTNHVYTVANTYAVVLSVLDDAGQKTVIPHNLTVGTGNPVPVITFSPTTVHPGTLVTFDASATTTSGGATITTYQWSFGDGGSSSSGPTTSHAFGLAGTYTVRLTVTDSQNRTGIATVTVTVS